MRIDGREAPRPLARPSHQALAGKRLTLESSVSLRTPLRAESVPG